MDNNSTVYSSEQYIVILVNKELFALHIDEIDSIVVKQKITRIPKSQPYYSGVINLRGEIVPIINLKKRLLLDKQDLNNNQISEHEYTNKTRFIIVKTDANEHVGLIVDEVKEVIELSESDISKIDHNKDNIQHIFSKGIGKYNKELITILNINSLISDK